MTQQQLAEAVGVHWITISKLERGKIKLTTDWLDRIATELGVRARDLLADDHSAEPRPALKKSPTIA